jgi:hypothetical protein
MKRSRFTVLVALAALVAAASLAATTNASAAGSATPAAVGQTTAGSVQISFAVKRFVARGGRLLARGQAIATVKTASGTHVERKNFQTRVVRVSSKSRRMHSASAVCDVLSLTLGPLRLELLGLIVELNQVVLTIKADSEGGLLGQLLCGLAGGGIATPKVATALTRKAQTSGLATPQVATVQPLTVQDLPPVPEGVCTVLDLVLGPIHLELLGLIVDLNQLHLRITADPEGGLLGSLLCPGIAGQPAAAG